MNVQQMTAVAGAYVALRAFARNSLSPTQTKWATEAAAELLWVLGLDQNDGLMAKRPEGEIIDAEVSMRAIEQAKITRL